MGLWVPRRLVCLWGVGLEEGMSDYGSGCMKSNQGGGLVLASGDYGCWMVWIGWIYCDRPTVYHIGQHMGGGVRIYLKVGGGS